MPEEGMELTLKVAVMSAAGFGRGEIVTRLDITESDVEECMNRLKWLMERKI